MDQKGEKIPLNNNVAIPLLLLYGRVTHFQYSAKSSCVCAVSVDIIALSAVTMCCLSTVVTYTT